MGVTVINLWSLLTQCTFTFIALYYVWYYSGKAQLSCQDHSNMDCDSTTCTESLETNSDNLVLNTTIQFVGGGKCQHEQIVTEMVLSRGFEMQWDCTNRTQCGPQRYIEPVYISDNNFNLALSNLSEENSGEYNLRVGLRHNGQYECNLYKSFNITGIHAVYNIRLVLGSSLNISILL